MSFKKKQVQNHFYSGCQVTHLTCLTCGKEYEDDSWREHDGSCMTIEAENKRTFGKFYKPKATKGNMFQPGRRVQHNYKGKWYGAKLISHTSHSGEWKLSLDYMNKTVTAKQHLIRRPKGKDAQELLGLIPEEDFKKLLEERDRKQNPHKYTKKEPEKTKAETPAKEEKNKEETEKAKAETPPKKVKKKKRKKENTDDPAEAPTKRRKKNKDEDSTKSTEKKGTKKIRVKDLKKIWKGLVESSGGSMTLKDLLKQTKKQVGKESQVVL